ncbi:hypothetical protein [Streptomyces sp. NPDC048277]|uniref:hypothetical protein n=1 Tax=Streptomyces sp. NPDC048277 TaxID=3155027 RepID=UPI0033EDDC7A
MNGLRCLPDPDRVCPAFTVMSEAVLLGMAVSGGQGACFACRAVRTDPSGCPSRSVDLAAGLAAKYGVHRRTVRQAMASAVPPPRKSGQRQFRILDPATGWIDTMLRADLRAPRKQKHTVERIQKRLAEEHDFDLASYSTLRNYVPKRRPEIVAEDREGRQHLEGMVPQEHLPGEEAEVDFADGWVRVAVEVVKCHLFTLRLSHSGKAIHRVFASQAQESFLEGHAEAFRVLGGVPTRHIRYDNLKPAVRQVCTGRNRVESERRTTFRSHYVHVPVGSRSLPTTSVASAAV